MIILTIIAVSILSAIALAGLAGAIIWFLDFIAD